MNQPTSLEFELELTRLARRLADGTMSALGDLYDLVGPRLLRYADMLTMTRDEAEDVVQASFLKLARHPRQLAKSDFPWPYLLKMLRNEACSLLYRKRKLVLSDELFLVAESEVTGEDVWEKREIVRQSLKQLPPVQAEVITLKIWEGLSFREIATVTDQSLHTVTSRYRYGMKKLSVLLSSYSPENVARRGLFQSLLSAEELETEK